MPLFLVFVEWNFWRTRHSSLYREVFAMKLFPELGARKKHFSNTWKVFFTVACVRRLLESDIRLCVYRRSFCTCVGGFLFLCAYFMTQSASLSDCIQFICVRFIFFLNGTFPCVCGRIFRVWVFCFFTVLCTILHSMF